MRVVRVFNRTNSKSGSRQSLDKLDQERRLSVVLSTEDMDSFHR